MKLSQVKRLRRLAGPSLPAMAAVLALAFVTAPGASASQSPPTRNGLAAAVRAAALSTCPSRPHSSGTTVRCAQVRRVPVSQLTAGDRALLPKALAEIVSRSHSDPRNPAAITPPAQCAFSLGTLFSPDRFTACEETAWQFQNIEITDGVPTIIGTFDVTDMQWVSFSGTSGSWTHGMIMVSMGGTGTLLGGFESELYSGCFLAQGVCVATSLTSPDPQTVTIVPFDLYTFSWVETDRGHSSITTGASNNLSAFLGVDFINTAPDGSSAFFFDNVKTGRCDTIATKTDRCVNQNFTPTLTYSAKTNPKVGPVAQHVLTAEQTLAVNWGVPPGHFADPQPLTRDMNPADIRLNRLTACRGVPPSCDEYPLATTHQGAAFQNAFSAVPVPGSANSSQGGITKAFYASNRVIDGDPFYVLAILANGTRSW